MKKITILASAFLLCACSPAPQEKKAYDASTLQAGFDTVITLKLYTESEDEFNEVFQESMRRFLYYNNLFDKYNDYEINNIKTINDNAGIQPIEVDQELIDMLLLSKKYSEMSHYQFDVTIGPILSLWHDVREKAEADEDYTLPTEQQLQEAKACSGWDKVEIDDEKNTVYLNNPCASLDVGAVAKGYATQLVANYLTSNGYVNGFINAGGNVQILGSKIDGSPWSTGILAPALKNSAQTLVSIQLNEADAFVTSGDYQRFFLYNDEIMHHIIDPDTLYPARHAKSITILTKDSGIADILSTTLFTMTYEEGLSFIKKVQDSGIEAQAVWIYDKLDEIQNQDYQEKDGYYILSTDAIKERLH